MTAPLPKRSIALLATRVPARTPTAIPMSPTPRSPSERSRESLIAGIRGAQLPNTRACAAKAAETPTRARRSPSSGAPERAVGLRLQVLDDGRIAERRGVAQLVTLRDVAQ